MCIIAIKKAGVKFPSDETLRTMWYNNPDGAGFMFLDHGNVTIRKGFMKLSEFMSAIKQARTEVDEIATPFVLHFRITTHGGTKPENCHPFPISDNVELLKKPVFHTNIGVAHNGIIRSVTPRRNISDTMEYIASQMAHMKKIDKRFYRNKNFLALIEQAIDSKMAILANDGSITTIGDFVEDNDMVYSNTSYKPRMWTTKTYSSTSKTASSYTPYSYGLWGDSESPKGKGVYKALMFLCDSGKENLVVTDSNGGMHDPEDFAIDMKGRVYRLDWETGCAYREDDSGSFSVIGDVKFNGDAAHWMDCYKHIDTLLWDYYSNAPF